MSGSECSGCYQTQKKTGYGQPVRAKTNSDEDLRKRTQDHQNPGFQLISNHNLQATVETNQFSNCRIRGGNIGSRHFYCHIKICGYAAG